MKKIFAGIEAGGTKFVCAIGDGSGEIFERTVIPTTMPHETMQKVIEFFKIAYKKTPFSAIGIAIFGPIDLNIDSPSYGYVFAPQKKGWDTFNIVGSLKEAFDMPIGFDTDVNGAAIGEARWGNGRGFGTLVYWTIGTGIGAGIVVSGELIHGLIHPEMGHTFIPHDKIKDPFKGVCPWHVDCFEGLASGPAMMERWQVKAATDLPPAHPGWDLEAEYIAYAMANCVVTISPQRIILGGGVMKHKPLYEKVQKKMVQLLVASFVRHKTILENISEYIVPPGLGGDSGICGAIALAEKSFYEYK